MALSKNDAAGLIGNIFGELEKMMNHLAKGTYDADAHNACVAYVEFANGTDETLFAYSDSSKMNKKIKGYCEIPDSSQYQDKFGLSQMQAAHTEPKLLNFIMNRYPSVGPHRFKHVTLATARDPCSSCTNVIGRFNNMYPGKITVYGFKAQTGGGVPDLSGTLYG